MTSLIVKNLPKELTEKKFKKLFKEKGKVASTEFKFSSKGKFKRIGYVEYKSEKDANEAVKFFNNSFIEDQQISVDYYNKDKKLAAEPEIIDISDNTVDIDDENRLKKKKSKKRKYKELECEVIEISADNCSQNETNKKDKLQNFSSVDNRNDNANGTKRCKKIRKLLENHPESLNIIDTELPSNDKQLSSSSKNQTVKESLQENKPALKSNSKIVNLKNETDEQKVKKRMQDTLLFVKISNISYFNFRIKRDLKLFFKPIKVSSIRLPGKFQGYGYVGFRSEKMRKEALKKNGHVLNGSKVIIEKILSPNKFETYLVISNLNLSAKQKKLQKLFAEYGSIESIKICTKQEENSDSLVSLGFGYVKYKNKEEAQDAFKQLHNSEFKGQRLEIKILDLNYKVKTPENFNFRNKEENIVYVTNIPAEASEIELKELFGFFGELKEVRMKSRLPKSNEKYAFIEYYRNQDLKTALQFLQETFVLYGKTINLERARCRDSGKNNKKRKVGRTFRREKLNNHFES